MVSLQAALVAMTLSGTGQTVMLDFSADWCPHCRAMGPTIDALVAKGYPVRRVDFDQDRALAARFGVTSLPCYIMLVDGQEVDRVAESTSFSRLERMCQLGARATPPGEPAAIAAEPSGQATRPQSACSADSSPPPQPAAIGPTGRDAEPMPTSPPAAPGTPLDVAPARAITEPVLRTIVDAPSTPDLIAVSVRLRVQDKDGRSCGSGTIIDNRDGEALVLTCGHLFRDSQGKGAISVDLFNSGMPQTVPGRLIFYSAPQSALDLSPDVGLVAIRCPGPVVIARLAPRDYRVKEGMAVVSVGCNNGDLPTARPSQVTRLNRFNGPPNIEVAGQPVEGRSGGGLFSPEGYVIGICNAADPEDREGYFGATASVYAELDREKLASVYQSPAGRAIGTLTSGPAGGPLPENGAELGNVAAGMLAPVLHGMMSAPLVGAPLNAPIAPTPPSIAMVPTGFTGPPAEATRGPLLPAPSCPTMPPVSAEDAQRSLLSAPSAAGAPTGLAVSGAGGSGHLIVVDLANVSAEFLEQLAAERRRQEQRQAKELAQSRPSRKLLEWSAANASLADGRGQGLPQLTRTSLEQRNTKPGTRSPEGWAN